MNRIQEEILTVREMVEIYCRHAEKHEELCAECEELLAYAEARLRNCPYGETKDTCRQCTIHCYRPDMKERIRVVMRYSGPRMMLYSPRRAFLHLVREMRYKLSHRAIGV